VLLKGGKSKEAVHVAQDFAQRFPELANSHFWLGQAQLQEGDYEGALTSHKKAVDMAPDWSQPYASLAQANARLGNQQEALEMRQEFATRKKAEEALDRESTRSYDDIDKQKQVLVKLHEAAGALHIQHGDARLAEAHWLRASQFDPQNVQACQSLVAIYLQQERLAAAAQLLGQLAVIEPDNFDYVTERSRLLMQMGRWKEARTSLERVVDQDRNSGLAHLLLAETLLNAGEDLPVARYHAERAFKLSGSSQALLMLAAVLEQEGDRLGARMAMEKAVAIDPENEQLRRALEQMSDPD
jgi:tetratricopeptide (TPR) repeat protein